MSGEPAQSDLEQLLSVFFWWRNLKAAAVLLLAVIFLAVMYPFTRLARALRSR